MTIETLVSAAVQTAAWEGTIIVEGAPTGDRRQFNEGCFTWAELPIPLGWKRVRAHGGMDVGGVVNVGRIDTIERVGNEIRATGVIDLGSAEGREVERQMRGRFLRGVSIDADDPENLDVEYVWPEGCSGFFEPTGDRDAIDCLQPALTIFHSARIRAATLCDLPAFVEAEVFLSDMVERDMRAMPEMGEALVAAAATIVIPDLPPAAWFEEPRELPEIGAITVTSEGRLFGLLAPANVAHRGYEQRKTVPRGNVDYSAWMNRPCLTEDGMVATGSITMGCGHAKVTPWTGAQEALEHYDNSCSIVASVRIGENRHGVWVAGALLPDVTAAQVIRMQACQLSGDWRPHRERSGMREFCGALLVPVPGFARATASVRMRAGTLVASTAPVHFEMVDAASCGCGPDTARAEELAALLGRDTATRAGALLELVNGKSELV